MPLSFRRSSFEVPATRKVRFQFKPALLQVSKKTLHRNDSFRRNDSGSRNFARRNHARHNSWRTSGVEVRSESPFCVSGRVAVENQGDSFSTLRSFHDCPHNFVLLQLPDATDWFL